MTLKSKRIVSSTQAQQRIVGFSPSSVSSQHHPLAYQSETLSSCFNDKIYKWKQFPSAPILVSPPLTEHQSHLPSPTSTPPHGPPNRRRSRDTYFDPSSYPLLTPGQKRAISTKINSENFKFEVQHRSIYYDYDYSRTTTTSGRETLEELIYAFDDESPIRK
jgi:hypothetical protein